MDQVKWMIKQILIRLGLYVPPQAPVVKPLSPLQPGQLSEAKRIFPRSKFFIYGYSRSGTTLLGRLARLHPDVHCNWQGHFYSHVNDMASSITSPHFQTWVERGSNHWTETQGVETQILRLVSDFLMERQAEEVGAKVVGDKTAHKKGARSIERLHQVYPDAALLYIIRDGRDVAVSKRIQLFLDLPDRLDREGARLREKFLADSQEFLAQGKSIFTQSWLSEFAQSWNWNIVGSVRAGQALFGPQFLIIKYEQLLQDASQCMTAVWDLLLPGEGPHALEAEVEREMSRNPSASWHAQKDPGLHQVLARGAIGGWRQFMTKDDRVTFERIAGQALKQEGYC